MGVYMLALGVVLVLLVLLPLPLMLMRKKNDQPEVKREIVRSLIDRINKM